MEVGLLEGIANTIGDVITRLGYLGIGGGMFIESACIPLPSEIVLPIGGFLAAEGKITLLGANIAVNVGSMLGSLLAYWVGQYGGRKFILSYGKYFFMAPKNFYQAEKMFNKFGAVAVFFGRLLPVIRTFISLPAGIAKMNLKKFIAYSLGGMIPWNFALILLGYHFKDNYVKVVRPIFKEFEYVVIAILAILTLLVAFKYFKIIKENNVDEADPANTP